MTLVMLLALGAAAAGMEREAFEEVNRYRAERGLRRLEWNDDAAELARRHCGDLLGGRARAAHEGFESRVARLKKLMKVRGAAENVGLLSRQAGAGRVVARQWMESEGHRRNVLGPYERTGIGVAEGGGLVCAAQILIGDGRQ